jgi:uncharacterized protein YpuA (DUF1002 family)
MRTEMELKAIDWGKLVDAMKRAENDLREALLEVYEDSELRAQMNTITSHWNKIRIDKGDYRPPRPDYRLTRQERK